MKTLARLLPFILLLTFAARARAEGLQNTDVIRMSKAGISPDLIIQKIQTSSRNFDLSVDALVQLKKAGVSDRVIGAMFDTRAAVPVPPESKTAGVPPRTMKPLSKDRLEAICEAQVRDHSSGYPDKDAAIAKKCSPEPVALPDGRRVGPGVLLFLSSSARGDCQRAPVYLTPEGFALRLKSSCWSEGLRPLRDLTPYSAVENYCVESTWFREWVYLTLPTGVLALAEDKQSNYPDNAKTLGQVLHEVGIPQLSTCPAPTLE